MEIEKDKEYLLSNAHSYIDEILQANQVTIFAKSYCPYCKKVMKILDKINFQYKVIELDLLDEFGIEILQELTNRTNRKTVPNVFINKVSIGGCEEIENAFITNRLHEMLNCSKLELLTNFNFDVIVIGGGSTGLAMAKNLAIAGKNVCICDIIEESTGVNQKLDGICHLNVGFITKYFMYSAGKMCLDLENATSFGWKLKSVEHEWALLIDNIRSYIKKLNWNNKKHLITLGVTYHNAEVILKTVHDVEIKFENDKSIIISGQNIILATESKARHLDIPGALDLCITSDELLSLKESPGKTLIIGGTCTGLECASFLSQLGCDVTIMIQSVILRGNKFDRGTVNKLIHIMKQNGIYFIENCRPIEIVRVESEKLRVSGVFENNDSYIDYFKTVLLAVGRIPNTKCLGLESCNIALDKFGKVIVNDRDQTNKPNIYAVGEIASGRSELPSSAILACKLLSKRLTSINFKDEVMDYRNAPKIVFTSPEYASVGYTEEIAKLNFKDVAVCYHSLFKPLERVLSDRPINYGYAKIICVEENKGKLKVIGIHLLGPNAGEIVQGFSLVIKIGVMKHQFDSLIGIHPTCAEVFTTLSKLKTDNEDKLNDLISSC